MEKRTLTEELESTLDAVNAQIHMVTEVAERCHVDRIEVMDSSGNFMMTPLLVAKAQVLGALAALK